MADLNTVIQLYGNYASMVSNVLGKINPENLIQMAKAGINLSNEFINANKKIDSMNDGLQTQLDLQKKIVNAAERSGGSYTNMVSDVSSMQSTGAFDTNEETLAFTELANKSTKVGQTDPSGQNAAMEHVTQIMSAGTMQGDDFTSIANNAPLIAEAIERYTDKSSEELAKMAENGEISSDLIKNAMFESADRINGAFDKLPLNFSNIMDTIKNTAVNQFTPIANLIQQLINSEEVSTIVNIILLGIRLIGSGVNELIAFMTDNWPMIQALLMATAIYLAAVLGPGFIAAGIEGLSAGLAIAAAWIMAMAPILLAIAAIALIIYAFMQMGVTVEDIFGVIGGIIGATIAGIWNLFLSLFELVLGIVNTLMNCFAVFVNYLANAFTNPISSIIYLFQGLADIVLGVLEKIASAMDFVFGSTMADTISEWRVGIKDMADKAVKEYAPDETYKKEVDNAEYSVSDFGLNRMDLGSGYNAGKKTAKDIYGDMGNKIKNLQKSLSPDDYGYKDDPDQSTLNVPAGTVSNPLSVKGTGANNTVGVDMSEEDMGYLRDLAERDYINQFKTATLAPNIQVTFGDIHENADANAIAGRIKTILQEEIATTAEGAYV
ncbi:MAG: tape measure protein [Velocimicrobium sp.]